MYIQLVIGSNIPIYKQICDQISREVATGKLKPGDQIPSVRVLAEDLVINPNTVARAYQDLVREGVLETQRAKGIYVADRRPMLSREERRRRLDAALNSFVHDVILLDLSPDEIVSSLNFKLSELSLNGVSGKEDGK